MNAEGNNAVNQKNIRDGGIEVEAEQVYWIG